MVFTAALGAAIPLATAPRPVYRRCCVLSSTSVFSCVVEVLPDKSPSQAGTRKFRGENTRVLASIYG